MEKESNICSIVEKNIGELSEIDKIEIVESLSDLKKETILSWITKGALTNIDITQEILDDENTKRIIVSGLDGIINCENINNENIKYIKYTIWLILTNNYKIPKNIREKMFSEEIYEKIYKSNILPNSKGELLVMNEFKKQAWYTEKRKKQIKEVEKDFSTKINNE